MAKTKTVELHIMPLPDPDFGRDEARESIRKLLPGYCSLLGDRSNSIGETWSVSFPLGLDVEHMVDACVAAIDGERVVFEHSTSRVGDTSPVFGITSDSRRL